MTARLLLTTTTTLAALTLAACGGGGAGDDGGGTGGVADDSARLAFGRCMRAAGIDFQDQGGTGGAEKTLVRVPRGIPPQRMQKIQADCAKQTGGGPKPPSKEDQARFLDQALQFAKCMRGQGIDLPDPQAGPGGGGIIIQRGSRGAGPNPSSRAFQEAEKACREFQPGGGARATSRAGGGPTFSTTAKP